LVPQAPQLLASFWVWTQTPEQLAWPVGQHLPPPQFWPAAQAAPQAPQLASLLLRLTHTPEQQVWPVPHLLPQVPQLLLSVWVLVQAAVAPAPQNV